MNCSARTRSVTAQTGCRSSPPMNDLLPKRTSDGIATVFVVDVVVDFVNSFVVNGICGHYSVRVYV